MRRLWPYVLLAVIVVLFLAGPGVSYLRHANLPVLQPAGPIGAQERNVMLIVAALSALVIVPVFFLLFYFAWMYRASAAAASARHEPNWDHDNALVEFSWWLVPLIIIAALSVVAWQTSHALDPYKPLASDELTVQVVALDWKWLFIYPQNGVASVNELEIPVGAPVRFELTADAPMNSFWIPSLGGQIMAMPGMTTQLNLEADREGQYHGLSANISGKGFAGMAFTVRAVPLDEFDAWISAVRTAAPTLSDKSYAALAAPSEYNTPVAYALADPRLYDNIVSSYRAPVSNTSAMSGMHM